MLFSRFNKSREVVLICHLSTFISSVIAYYITCANPVLDSGG